MIRKFLAATAALALGAGLAVIAVSPATADDLLPSTCAESAQWQSDDAAAECYVAPEEPAATETLPAETADGFVPETPRTAGPF